MSSCYNKREKIAFIHVPKCAGTAISNYLIKVTACSNDMQNHRMRIYDVTNSAERIIGLNGYGATAYSQNTISYLSGRLTPSGSTEYRLEQISDQNRTNSGHGAAQSLGGNEVYTTIEIFKEL